MFNTISKGGGLLSAGGPHPRCTSSGLLCVSNPALSWPAKQTPDPSKGRMPTNDPIPRGADGVVRWDSTDTPPAVAPYSSVPCVPFFYHGTFYPSP